MSGDVNFKISGDDSELKAALKGAQAATIEATERMKASLESVGAAFEKINVAMAAVTAVLAGGAAFKEAVDASVNAAKGAEQLGRQLGITATQASVLRVAMDENHVSQDAVTAAAAKIATSLKKNEQSFKDLGVATRDNNGNYKDSLQIMLAVNERLADFKEGTDRNVEGQKIYGRSWFEIQDTLRLSSEKMAEAKVTADSLGLTIGAEGAARVDAYRTSMAGVHDVFEGVMKAIGDGLLPYLTQLGNWFRSIGPTAVEYTKKGFVGLVAVVEAVKVAIITFFNSVMLVVDEFMATWNLLVNVLDRVLHLDWAGAKQAWNQGLQQIEDIAKQRAHNIAQAFEDAQTSVGDAADRAFNKQTETTDNKGGGAGSEAATGSNKQKSRMGDWDAELAKTKAAFAEQSAAQGQFQEFSKQAEVDFWQSKLAIATDGSNDQTSIETKLGGLRVQIARDAFQAQLADLKAQEGEYRSNLDAKLAIAKDMESKIAAAYGDESKEAKAAAAEVVRIERDKQAQLQRIDALRQGVAESIAMADIDAAETEAKLRVDLGLGTNDKLLAQEVGFENERYRIKQQALQQSLRLAEQDPDRNPVELARIHAELETLELQHKQKILDIRAQMVIESNKYSTQMWKSMESGFGSVLSGLLRGTATIAQTFRGLVNTILNSISDMLAQMAAKWLAQRLLNIAGAKTEAAANISASSAAAGAAGTASFAGAPWPIDLGAPAFGLAMAAAAAAFAPAAAAEQGFDVPAGMSPVTKLHPKEMVLPSALAEGLRGLVDGQGQRGGITHVHLPGRKLGNFYLHTQDELTEAIRAIARSGSVKFS